MLAVLSKVSHSISLDYNLDVMFYHIPFDSKQNTMPISFFSPYFLSQIFIYLFIDILYESGGLNA